jgi:hypothetical protein
MKGLLVWRVADSAYTGLDQFALAGPGTLSRGRRPLRAVNRDNRWTQLTQIVRYPAGGDNPSRRRHKPLGVNDGDIEALACADIDSSPKAGNSAAVRNSFATCLEPIHVMRQ